MEALEGLRDLVWGPGMLILLLGAGLFLTAAAGLPQFRLRTVWRSTFGSLKNGGRRSLDAMLTALGGTIGTGNIVGVSAALASGGPGALFWMAAAAVVGMATKYAEIWLAVRWRVRSGDGWRGGGMYVLERALRAPRAGRLFAALCVLTSFGIGSAVQANAAAEALREGFGWDSLWGGLLLAFLCALTLFGTKGAAQVNARLVPAMGLLYAAGAVVCLIRRREALPEAFHAILVAAFHPEAAVGGAAGYTLAQAVRFGVARGLFTNEAGMGSAPIAHASAEGASPARQGCWGVVEVGLDTLLMCSLTGLVLLTAETSLTGESGGFARTLSAFRDGLGGGAGLFLCVSMVCFAFASMLAWAQYGTEALFYLTGSRGRDWYAAVFAVCAAAGACADGGLLWAASDLCNAAMCLPNLAGTVILWARLRWGKDSPGRERKGRGQEDRSVSGTVPEFGCASRRAPNRDPRPRNG